ncbi:hypothetical protein OF83DRAFT_780154 [Amylostereum chailletii]|nr:hypothetical protein OF83DRAFT_780154 [Amylostereum chailletii]
MNKGDAASIESDEDWSAVRDPLLRKRPRDIYIEFDLDSMEVFRIRKRPIDAVLQDENDGNSALSTEIPKVDSCSEEVQRHAKIILDLKARHKCDEHRGEHGEAGCCYKAPDGSHLGLNRRRLKRWASAIDSLETTPKYPPNTEEFDGVRDGRLQAAKPRGRTGPRLAATSAPTAPSQVDTSTALIPMVAGLVSQQGAMLSAVLGMAAPMNSPAASISALTPPSSSTSTPRAPPFSPLPPRHNELFYFLLTFLEQDGHDLLHFHDILASANLTVATLSSISLDELVLLTGGSEDVLRILVAVARRFFTRLQMKKDFVCSLLSEEDFFGGV